MFAFVPLRFFFAAFASVSLILLELPQTHQCLGVSFSTCPNPLPGVVHRGMTKILVEAGANLEARTTTWKETALHAAAENGHTCVISLTSFKFKTVMLGFQFLFVFSQRGDQDPG